MNADEAFTEAPPERIFDAAMMEATDANDNRMAPTGGGRLFGFARRSSSIVDGASAWWDEFAHSISFETVNTYRYTYSNEINLLNLVDYVLRERT